jgi:hypothetical protein
MWIEECSACCKPNPPKSKREEHQMQDIRLNVNSTTSPTYSPEQESREYLCNRLSAAYFSKDADLERAYGLRNDSLPETPQEMVDRILAGKYVINKREYGDDYYGDLLDYFSWRDPAIKKDRDGYDAAHKILKAAHNKASDQIYVLSAAEGLKALQEFEATEFK